jgi:hypothetical protein
VKRALIFFSIPFVLLACAYHIGDRGRALPGGYDQIAIPVFSNKSDEVSIETYFTNALRREFERSKVARVTSKDEAPVTLEGEITKVQVIPSAQALAGQNLGNSLPGNTVLNTEYRVLLTAHLRLRRHSDQKIVWEQEFNREHVYDGPQIGADFINSANALYEQSSRLQTISQLADEMMEEAHDCLTENF